MHNAKIDCRDDYDQALKGLINQPDSIPLKHQAVLALARAGSLKLAQSEFQRYGLSTITDNEDVLGLGARLLKDAFHQSTGTNRNTLARQSADMYQAAFKATGGYYSGINAATMTLLAGGDDQDIRTRSGDVLERLPDTRTLSSETLYFIEATRAEALLLLSQRVLAAEALRLAWQHDPLNYTAHASTLRQLKLICKTQGLETTWLDQFAPPGCVHYAGHTFSTGRDLGQNTVLSDKEEQLLRAEISNSLQQNDIGFGYGALSAGSDILIAEALLDEGADLHIVLPVSIEQFQTESVDAYGDNWTARFKACLSDARSITVLAERAAWPDRALNQYAGKIAMGNAILQANFLASRKAQLLVMHPAQTSTFTADHLQDWQQTGYETLSLSLPGHYRPNRRSAPPSSHSALHIAIATRGDDHNVHYAHAREAALAALTLQASSDQPIEIGIHCSYGALSGSASERAQALSNHAVPGSILVSSEFAGLLAAEAVADFVTYYAGRMNAERSDSPATYSLAYRSASKAST